MSRFWPDGVPIVVTYDELATPIAFSWERNRHVVERWRVDEGWWRTTPAGAICVL